MHGEIAEIDEALVAGWTRLASEVLRSSPSGPRWCERSRARRPSRPGHVRRLAGETRLVDSTGYRFLVVDQMLPISLAEEHAVALVSAFARVRGRFSRLSHRGRGGLRFCPTATRVDYERAREQA